MSSLVRQTLAEQARDALLAEILSGALRPGARLLPAKLAERFGISVTPVKEALILLAVDGLIAASARRGASVRVFTSRDLDELFEVRAVVELAAVKKLLSRVHTAELEHLFQLGEGGPSCGQTSVSSQALSCQMVNLGGTTMMRQMHTLILNQIAVAIAPGQLNAFQEEDKLHRELIGGDLCGALATLSEQLSAQRASLNRQL